ncbi:MAG: S-methyl-5-thioribose-1-phosphate isomerase [Proteobacteria bacterium]|nr:S-methyl-5-thioribose-1-phosphate isomerase [Pseudomonadota bacterium]
MSFKTIDWQDDKVVMIDQRLLPEKEIYREYSSYLEVAEAIKEMVVRGAPAIGVAAAMGIALGAREIESDDMDSFSKQFSEICSVIGATRPTAVNLFWAIERMKRLFEEYRTETVEALKGILKQEAISICHEDIAINREIGKNGGVLLKDGSTVLTHCNAGALATAGYGTALGVIRSAIDYGKNIKVLADETRPFLQGARLTAWELMKDGIDVTVITDNMSGHLMKKGDVDAVVVGADRIASNGDVANKIGTYMVAVLAARHGIPFYVAAPLSTIDLAISTGDDIPIEERTPTEVTHIKDRQITPEGVNIKNPAFDVTPAELITAIITEEGVVSRDYIRGLKGLFEKR